MDVLRSSPRWFVWVFGCFAGAVLLGAVTFQNRAAQYSSSQARDYELFRRYAAQLLELRDYYGRDGGLPVWERFILGYWTPEEIERDLEQAYRGAAEGGFLTGHGHVEHAMVLHALGNPGWDETLAGVGDAPGEAPEESYFDLVFLALSGGALPGPWVEWAVKWDLEAQDWWSGYLRRQAADDLAENALVVGGGSGVWLDRYLSAGRIGGVLWVASMFAMGGSVWFLVRRGKVKRSRLLSRWEPSAGLSVTFWGLLLGTMACGVLVELSEATAPGIWEDQRYYLAVLGLYVVSQGVPAVVGLALMLPDSGGIRRAFRLEIRELVRPWHLVLVLGLYGFYSLAGWGLYEIQSRWVALDTRDFLRPGLIDSGWTGLASELAAAAVVAPLGEELLFRGILYSSLRNAWPAWVAAVVSSLIFAGLHYYSWFGVLTIAGFGVLMCWVYERTGSLWPPIAFHALLNLTLTLSGWYVFSEPV